MQALELMKTHVVKTTPDAPLSEAVDLMDLYQVSGLPVVDAEGRLCGMLTEADVLKAILPQETAELSGLQAEGLLSRLDLEAGNRPVSLCMTQPAICVLETDEICSAAQLMFQKGLKRLPVTTEQNIVIGTLNRVDVFQVLFEGHL